MSQDIRSFFAVQSSSRGNHEPAKRKSKQSNASSQKKKRPVIESDSEEEVFVVKKTVKTTLVPDSKKPKIEYQNVNASDVFGSDAVKRTNREGSSKSTEKFHDDPDFDQVLQDLDESEWINNSLVSKHDSSSSSKPSLKESLANKSLSTGKNHVASDTDPSASLLKPDDRGESPKSSITNKASNEMKKDRLSENSSKRIKLEKEDDVLFQVKSESKHFSSGASSKEKRKNYPPKDQSNSVRLEETLKTKVEPTPPSFMWVDKYKPSSVKNIIGQQGDNSNVKKLVRWLSNWHSNHGAGVNKKLVRPSPWAKEDNGSFFKAALLSGPPGVGKTTTAHLVCKELGMDVVEFNASDTRSQKLMSKEVSELLSSKSLVPFFQSSGGAKTSEKHVLVMDEVDGMAGNEDRGGVGELINLIKNSKCPVICMCNDRNHPKIRSLAGHCFDLRFHKPRVEQIRGAMMSVCFKEKVRISPQALDEVIAGTNCDIRQVLHNLSMWSSANKNLNPDQVKNDVQASKKNIKLGPWDAIRKIFSAEDHKNMTLIDKSDLFFHDYNILPLFVQENYLIVSPQAAKNKTDVLRQVALAACSVSYGDLVEKTIRSTNSWSLLPVQSIFSSVVPGERMEGHFSGQIQFPSWLGKNSRGGKLNRLLQELQMHMRLSISGGKQAVNLNYLEPVLNSIIHPLIAEGAQGVQKTLNAMQSYYITRDDLESLLELCRWPGQSDPMASVESKVKAALTRAYNKAGGFMTPYALDGAIKKKKAVSAYEEGFEGDEEHGFIEEDESDDNDTVDAMIKEKKPTTRGDVSSSNQRSSAKSVSGESVRGGSRGRSQARGRGRGRGKK